jgi:hypothetical protein
MSISQNYPTVRPQLLIDLANTQKLDPRLTFARASVGTYYDESGVLQTAPSGVARFQFDPVTGESQGLLRENQATNLLTYSEQFDNAAWLKSNATITSNTVIAPDGTLTGDKLVENTANAAHFIYSGSQAFVSGTSYTLSVYAKKGERQYLVLQLPSAAFSSASNATFDLDSATFNLGAGSPTASITDVGNGVYRCSITKTATSSASSNGAFIYVTNSASATINAYTGDGTSGIYIWGAQNEANSYPTSYIKTVASQVTRAADTATLTNTDAYNTAEFTAVSSPFGVSGVSANTVTLNGDVPIERLYVYPRNISQNEINTLVENDGWWSWRIVGSDFALPIFLTNGTVIVDWGDGTVETLTTAVHTFTNASPHTVRFKMGSGTTFTPRINANATHKNKVVAVGSAPSNMIVVCNIGFSSCTNLKSFDATLIGGTDFSNAWGVCTSLTSFPLIDTSAGTNFSFAWNGCTGLTSFPAIDTSAVTNFSYAWNNCTSLTSFPLIDTSAGTTFLQAWQTCNSLTSFPLIDTSSGTVFTNTWYGCTSLTSFPLINTSVGTSFSQTWFNCNSLTSFPLINTGSGTSFVSAWHLCASLTSFPQIDTSSGTNFSDTWNGCSSLTSFPLLDMSLATNLNECWDTCTSLTSFPAIDFPVCTNFTEAWSGCSSLTSFPLIDTSAGTNFINTWFNCSSLTSFPLINTSSGTNFTNAWRNCYALTSFPLININNGTNFTFCWEDCNTLTDFPAGMFDSWTGVPVPSCFVETWGACGALTTTSVENILVSIDTSGVSAPATNTEITIDYNVSTGALTTPTTDAITSLQGKSWTIKINGVLQ